MDNEKVFFTFFNIPEELMAFHKRKLFVKVDWEVNKNCWRKL